MAARIVEVRNEDLRVGDMVQLWLGRLRIVAIRPYVGPLDDCLFAIAETDRGVGFSLEKGGYTSRVEVP